MGKKTKYPEYTNGSISVNGRQVASTVKDKNNNIISSNYNMSNAEQKTYNAIQQGLYNSLGNLFSISDNQRNEWSNQLNAMRNQGISEINNTYTPMETNLKNDIASRFGNFDNSIFLDNLNSITDKKSKAIADLSDNLLSKQNELYSDELKNRINTITLLNNLNSVMNANILNYTNAAASNSSAGNNYNSNWYNAMAAGAGGGAGEDARDDLELPPLRSGNRSIKPQISGQSTAFCV